MKIKPLSDKILIKPVFDTPDSPIILPDNAKENDKPERGKVMALGTGRILENGTTLKFNVEIGDIVLFNKYSPSEIVLDNETFLFITEKDILAVI